ncbi:MAG: hypothetical protein ABWY71_03075 [Candidatus Saccharimonadales bacterium]
MQSPADNEPSLAKRMFKAGLYGVGLWIVSFFVAAFVSLGSIRDLTVGHGAYVSLGPFKYLYVHKSSLPGGGFTLTINLCIGLFLFLGTCIAVELLVAWLVRRRSPKKESTDA